MSKLPAGHGWAYLGVVVGLAASLAGNVANTVLTPGVAPLELRIPFAVLWPVFVGIGIEVLTRVNWHQNWRHWGARAFLMGPMTLVAAFMSYLHLRHLMILSGEPGLAQGVGPLAVDGTLFGCTVALLVTRAASMTDTARTSLAERVAAARTAVLDIKDAAVGKVPVLSAPPVPVSPAVSLPISVSPAVTSVAPVSPGPVGPRTRTRAVSSGSWDAIKAVQLILEGERSDAEIAETVGIGVKMIQRTRRAVTLVRTDPRAEIPAEWKVPARAVQAIRTEGVR